ncbi:putative phage abortive infection protein [Lactococcus petauri]|uniref:putative phage abortive infection protein n=1 Tax=Lactococcus petauri TaxID=1940789 RepID=UPI0038538D77
MNKFLKNTLVIIVMVLISEFAINQSKIFSMGTESDWFSFLGNVFGAGVGVLGAYIILQIQLKNDSKKYEETQIDNTFFNMLTLFQSTQSNLNDTCTSILESIGIIKDSDIKHMWDEEKEKVFKDNYKQLKEKARTLLAEETIEPGTDEHSFISHMETVSTSIPYRLQLFEAAYSELPIDNYLTGEELTQKGKESITFFKDLKDKLEIIDNKYSNYEFNENEIFQLVDRRYSFYTEIGTFLRMFYRIVKYIMDSGLSMKKKKEYLGMVRALLSSDEMLVIFYNCFYTTRGVGLKKILSRVDKKGEKTGFFADELDLQHFNIKEGGQVDLPFFKYSELIFGDSDLEKIKSLTNLKKELK